METARKRSDTNGTRDRLTYAATQAARVAFYGAHYLAARLLARQTVAGSGALLAASNEDAAALRKAVTSPGGTTIEGLHELEKGKFRAAAISAVRAATEKSKKLGQGS